MKSRVLILTTMLAGCYQGVPTGADTDGGAEGGDTDDAGSTGELPETDLDVGRIALHRLTRAEYENTLRDLFGAEFPEADFIRGGTGVGFDNEAALLRDISEDLAEGYIVYARTVAAQVAEDPALLGQVSSCESDDEACLQDAFASFGARAWRRPLEEEEVGRLLKLYQDVRSYDATHPEALGMVVRAVIGSPHFVFHIELDPDPEDPTPHRVDAYALASRLSYMLWSSMPDPALFDAAADGSLLEVETLEAQVDRMLDDPRSDRFQRTFLEAWLHVPLLDAQTQLIDIDAYPGWSTALADDMRAELRAYLNEFVEADLPWSEFLTTDVNYVTPRLASHYGMPVPQAEGLTRVEGHDDARTGFLGLAGFLTYTSRADRTAPTLRGKIVLESLQCTVLTVPPNVPELDPDGDGQTEFPSIRERLEEHRKSPDCAGCHNMLDPIGLSLENFDAIGSWRDTYEDGYVIDASSELGGVAIDGLLELAPAVAQSPAFTNCPPQKLSSYALRRVASGDDRKFITAIAESWDSGSIRDLVKLVVTSEAFRFRRGED